MPYDPFGNILDPTTGKRRRAPGFKQNQGYTREGNIIQPFAFTGYREEENDFYYAQVRSYDPQAGRFTGEDRIRGLLQKPDSINHYCYCYGNPLDYIDQNGQFAVALPAVYAFIEAAVIVVGEVITTVASAAAEPYIVAGIAIGIVASLGINAAINAYNNYQANKQQGTVVTDEVDVYSKTAEDNIDIIPQGNIQTPTIEAPYAMPQEGTSIDVVPNGNVLTPELLKPWEVFPSFVLNEPSAMQLRSVNYESESNTKSLRTWKDVTRMLNNNGGYSTMPY